MSDRRGDSGSRNVSRFIRQQEVSSRTRFGFCHVRPRRAQRDLDGFALSDSRHSEIQRCHLIDSDDVGDIGWDI